MKRIKSIGEIKEHVALTIGNFDGVHEGHRFLIEEIKKRLVEAKLKLLVLTFVPHPRIVLKSDNNLLINSYDERRAILEGLGVDYLLEVEFDRDVSNMTPETFLKGYIISEKENVKKIYFGYDFVFGVNKSGDINNVRKFFKEIGQDVKVEDVKKFMADHQDYSSTKIRELLLDGNVEEAGKMLGRTFWLNGSVVKGDSRGRTLGFATANIKCSEEFLIPKNGVYLTSVILNDINYDSVTNIGTKPTFSVSREVFVESHILNFDKEIYGENLKVLFYKKIRDEKKFSSKDELIKQIKLDIKMANEFKGK